MKKLSNLLIQCLMVMEISAVSFMLGQERLTGESAIVIVFFVPVATYLISYFHFPTDNDFITAVKEYKSMVIENKVTDFFEKDQDDED